MDQILAETQPNANGNGGVVAWSVRWRDRCGGVIGLVDLVGVVEWGGAQPAVVRAVQVAALAEETQAISLEGEAGADAPQSEKTATPAPVDAEATDDATSVSICPFCLAGLFVGPTRVLRGSAVCCVVRGSAVRCVVRGSAVRCVVRGAL